MARKKSTRVTVKYGGNTVVKNKGQGDQCCLGEIRQGFKEKETLLLEGQVAIFQMGEVCGGGHLSRMKSMYKGTEA